MDAVTDPAIEEVVVMSAIQCGKTELILNPMAYYIAYDPFPCLIVMPNGITLKTFCVGCIQANGSVGKIQIGFMRI